MEDSSAFFTPPDSPIKFSAAQKHFTPLLLPLNKDPPHPSEALTARMSNPILHLDKATYSKSLRQIFSSYEADGAPIKSTVKNTPFKLRGNVTAVRDYLPASSSVFPNAFPATSIRRSIARHKLGYNRSISHTSRKRFGDHHGLRRKSMQDEEFVMPHDVPEIPILPIDSYEVSLISSAPTSENIQNATSANLNEQLNQETYLERVCNENAAAIFSPQPSKTNMEVKMRNLESPLSEIKQKFGKPFEEIAHSFDDGLIFHSPQCSPQRQRQLERTISPQLLSPIATVSSRKRKMLEETTKAVAKEPSFHISLPHISNRVEWVATTPGVREFEAVIRSHPSRFYERSSNTAEKAKRIRLSLTQSAAIPEQRVLSTDKSGKTKRLSVAPETPRVRRNRLKRPIRFLQSSIGEISRAVDLDSIQRTLTIEETIELRKLQKEKENELEKCREREMEKNRKEIEKKEKELEESQRKNTFLVPSTPQGSLTFGNVSVIPSSSCAFSSSLPSSSVTSAEASESSKFSQQEALSKPSFFTPSTSLSNASTFTGSFASHFNPTSTVLPVQVGNASSVPISNATVAPSFNKLVSGKPAKRTLSTSSEVSNFMPAGTSLAAANGFDNLPLDTEMDTSRISKTHHTDVQGEQQVMHPFFTPQTARFSNQTVVNTMDTMHTNSKLPSFVALPGFGAQTSFHSTMEPQSSHQIFPPEFGPPVSNASSADGTAINPFLMNTASNAKKKPGAKRRGR